MKIDYSRIPILLVTISAIIGTLRVKSLLPNECLILVILWTNTFIDIYATTLSLKVQNNSAYYNILISFELILTLGIYFYYLPKGILRVLILLSSIILTFFSILNLIYFQNFFTEFASYTFFLGGFMVSLYSYFLWRYEVEKNIISASNIILWFAGANFLYYSIAVPVMSANNWLVQFSSNQALPVHGINLFMYALWALIIGVGFLWKNKLIK